MESRFYKRRIDNSKKELLIIGSSEYGPTNAIVTIDKLEDVTGIFGYGGTIYESYKQIAEKLNDDASVSVIKCSGSHSTHTFNINVPNDSIKNSLILTSIYSNEIYNEVKINICEEYMEFTFPQGLYLEPARYYYSDYDVVGMLVNAINEDTYNSKNVVIANTDANEYTPFNDSFYVINDKEVFMSGGSSGLDVTRERLYIDLHNTYEIISGEEFTLIALTNAFVDDNISLKHNDDRVCTYYEQLLKYCVKQLSYGIVTVGFMSFNDIEGKDIVKHVNHYMSLSRSNTSYINFYFLISVVCSDIYYDYKSKISNALMFYCVLYLNLTNSNTTNKYIDDSYSLKSSFTYEEIERLNSIGVVSVRHSPYYDKIVPVNGITSVTYENDYKYIVNISMIQTIIPSLKSELEEFIGEDISTLIKNKVIDDAIKKIMSYYTYQEIISKYECNLMFDELKHELVCELNLKTSYMVEYIKVVGKINFNQLEEM